jgi:Mrp family chromosome partitioning ATPase
LARASLRGKRWLVDPSGPFAGPFVALRLAVELQPARSGNAVLFTSPQRGAGTSTIAANYALVAARTQGRVLLVDSDLRDPSLHRFFDVPSSPGLMDVLRDGVEPGRVTHTFAGPGELHLLTAGASSEWHGDFAASRQMDDLLSRAREEFDLVVLDSPPVLAAADASGLASHDGVDVVMVVAPRGRKRALVRAMRTLKLTEARLLGFVLNREGDLVADAA